MAIPAFATLQCVIQAVAHRNLTDGLLDVVLDLFNGHDVPALYWCAKDRRTGFYKGRGMPRALMFEAHLLGAVLAGSYPFKGTKVGCGCAPRQHVCDGFGCTYFCIDLDAKKGEQDIPARTSKLLGVCWRVGLLPVVFSSRSGNGVHVYVFLDDAVTTREAHAVGRMLAQEAGIMNRCDVIPSAEHDSGVGTLHALPLSPMAEDGGGILYDSYLRPVHDPRTVVSFLRGAHVTRSPAMLVRGLAAGIGWKRPESAGIGWKRLEAAGIGRNRLGIASRLRYGRANAKPSPKDDKILKAMHKRHPQFRKALRTPANLWRGKRSSRDAYLAGYMRRQGVSPAGTVAELLRLPGTKARKRGSAYAWALVESIGKAPIERIFAGQSLRPQQAKQQRLTVPWAPWAARLAPPQSYGDTPNPWWRSGVQERLKVMRSKIDGIALAYLVDRYYQGAMRQRMFYAGRRELGRALGYPSRTVGASIHRLADRFSDVLCVVPGVSHPRLRLANGFYVPERGHNDAISWYLRPGRDGTRTLISESGSMDPGHGSTESSVVGPSDSYEPPF